MEGITVTMALVDFLPVVMFFIAAVILQRDLYNKMVKGAFALLASGSILTLLSGIYKAGWKILYATGVCDFVALDKSFFLLQAPGFILIFASLISLLTRHGMSLPTGTAAAVAVPVYESNIIFIIGQVLGSAGVQFSLFAISRRMRKPVASILFITSFVFLMGMGYLSAVFDDSSSMHWLAQGVNIISQGSLLFGVWILHKAGLAKADSLCKR